MNTQVSPFLLVTSLAALAAVLPATAQNATTTPVGVVTLEVKAKPATSRSLNFLSLPLLRPAIFSGVIPSGGVSSSNGTTVLTFSENTFSGNLAAPTAPHYLEISTGDHAGITSPIISNSDSTLTLADDLTQVLQSGTTTISVRPNWTLGTAFPNGNGFQKGTTPNNSDTLVLFNPDTGATLTYFYNSTFNEWRTGGTPSNNAIIPPDSGFWIERKSTVSGFSIQLIGEVKINQSAIFIGGNSVEMRTLAPNLYPLNSVSLQDSGLYTGNSTTGLAAGTTPYNSDNLIVYDPVTSISTTYYYSSTNNRWQTGGTPANDFTIPSNSSVMIVRKSLRPSFVWYLPRPAMQLN